MGMRCIQCGADNLLADRTRNNGHCKQCNHPFAFEPATVTDKKFAFTDPFFKKAIDDISSQNILFFTPKQFLYFIDRRLKAKNSSGLAWILVYFFLTVWGFFFFGAITGGSPVALLVLFSIFNLLWILTFFSGSESSQQSSRSRRANAINLQVLGILIAVVGIFISTVNGIFAGYIMSAILAILSVWLGYFQRHRQQKIGEEFIVTAAMSAVWLQRWQSVNGEVEKLLPAPVQAALPASIDPEVSAYSFDRAIVCDSDAIAQFLIANNVHFENNCAILSIGGYPQNIFNTVIEMLRRNPDLKVYALHDASAIGVSLIYQLRSSSEWFANQAVTILDLGVSPRQILANRNLFVQKSEAMAQAARQLPDAVRQSLTAQEIAWLEAGNCVELESFTPQRLLRVVNYGLAQTDPQSNDGLILVDDGAAYGGGYVFVSDSFG
ncbi:hypothetical protein H6F67_26895 [Microcoleus sp. FACHB-1515]|uniref:hypothetical protein n=1 Tax=Cyanophyceae TaxID=3028117 RepID=UPI001684C367|nr:hypothetical protein [Microcoleus sp. FACHB-1515]MBD2093469.1 hypothetical protein [Microcoleus sp. FACHB-1515]